MVIPIPQVTKPGDMPDLVWGSLIGYLAYQGNVNGFRSQLIEVKYKVTAETKRGYWRARLTLNDVPVRIYYSRTKQRWVRN